MRCVTKMQFKVPSIRYLYARSVYPKLDKRRAGFSILYYPAYVHATL